MIYKKGPYRIRSLRRQEREYDRRLGHALREAAVALPEGWAITAEIQHHSGIIQLIDPDGETVDYPSNHEYLHESAEDALEYVPIAEEVFNATDTAPGVPDH